MPRFAAVYLPSVRVELARARMAEGEARAPLAVVIARPGGVVKDERSLLGQTRIDEVSPEARACGVRVGMTIAAARAKTSELRVRVVRGDAVSEVLSRVAEAGLAFGATTSFDAAADVACVDVTGAAHLFGDEATLAAKLHARVRTMGHACLVAVADGARVAAAAARYWPRGPSGERAVLVPPGENARAMSVMPLSALPLPDEARAWLSRIGMKRVGDLQKLPRASLGTRLGAEAREVMALICGDDAAPIAPYVPPEVPEERAELDHGIEGIEPFLFVAKTLCDRMGPRLAGRGMGAARLEIEMKLDRAAREEPVPGRAMIEITLPVPLVEPQELLGVIRARVESYTVLAPILEMTLRVPELARRDARPLDLFVPEAKADRALPRLTAELAADLGGDRVGTLGLVSTWVPEARTRLLPYGSLEPQGRGLRADGWHRDLLSFSPEPARILTAPIACGAVRVAKLLSRVEAVEWWRRPIASFDYLAAWMDDARAVAWVEIDRRTGEARVRGWMD